jgi:P-type E1-E2 ATPase
MIGWDQWVRGVFVLEEQDRPTARQTLAELRTLGLEVAVLTGDRPERAREFARLLDVEVQGGLLPEEKVAAVNCARQRRRVVAMIGDGLNDVTALAAADVGIAMGCGADVSREAADLCLLGNDLSRLPWAVRLARQTVRVIRQNLFWSLAYNSLGIGLAISGRLNPIWAAGAMTLSSFFVVANSLRIGMPTAGSVSNDRHSTDSSAAAPNSEITKSSRSSAAIRCMESPATEFIET